MRDAIDCGRSQRALEARTSEMLSFLKALVDVECDTRHKPGVDEAADLVEGQLRELGFAIRRVRQATVGDQRVAEKPGQAPRVLVLTHVDSVFPRGSSDASPGRRDGDRFYGLGAVDMKGGIVILLEALRTIRDLAPSLYDELDLSVVVNTDEETGSVTSRELLEAEARKARAVLVTEAARPGGEYVTARKAVARLRLTFRGRAAHAGLHPELGADAVRALIETVKPVYGLADRETGTTINVGVVSGGTKAGVVPDLAAAEIDVRAWEDAKVKEVLTAIEDLAARCPVAGVAAEAGLELLMPAMPRTAGGRLLFEMVRETAQDVGFEARDTSTGAFSDANYVAGLTPTVDALGPRGGNPHTPDEYLSIASLVPRAQVILHFLSRWPGNAGRLAGENPNGRETT